MPTPPAVSVLIRFAIVALTMIALLRLLPRASGAENFTVYVSNERDGTVSVIDGATHEVTRNVPVGKRPRGIHVSHDGRTLLVATSGSPRMAPGADRERAQSLTADKSADGIAVIDLATFAVVRRLPVGSDPEEFALSADGREVIVANEDIAEASQWELATGTLRRKMAVTEEPEGVALHPAGREVYVTCEEHGDVFMFDAGNGTELGRVRLGGRPRSVAFSADGSLAYVPLESKSAVAIIDTRTRQVKGQITLPPPALPMDSVSSRDGRELYVSTGRGNSIAVIDTASHRMVANIPVGTRVWGIGLSPDGTRLFTANGISNDVSVVDLAARREIARISVGDGPWGIAIGR